MVQIWYGDEQYLMKIQLHKMMEEIECPELNVTVTALTSETSELAFFSAAFGNRRMVVYNCDDMKNTFLGKLLSRETDNDVIVIVKNMDKRLSIFKQLKKEQVCEFRKLSGEAYENFLRTRIRAFMVNITDREMYEYVKTRMCYNERPSCTLYTVEGWLKQMASIGSELTRENVDEIVPRYVDEDQFQLIRHMSAGDKKGYYDVLNKSLKSDDGIGTLSLLLYNFRVAYKVGLVGKENAQAELGVTPFQLGSLPKVTPETALKVMDLLQDGVNRIKHGDKGKDVAIVVSSQIFDLVA